MILRASARFFSHIGAIAGHVCSISGGMPQTPSGGGSIVAADVALALGDDVDEGLAVEAQRHRPPQLGIVEGRLVAVDEHRARLTLVDITSQIACGACALNPSAVGIVTP